MTATLPVRSNGVFFIVGFLGFRFLLFVIPGWSEDQTRISRFRARASHAPE
jgi:hypothetical protein